MSISVASSEENWKERFLSYLYSSKSPNYQLNYLTRQLHHSITVQEGELKAEKAMPFFTPLPHQINAVKKVVFEMNGHAILADEVGLGKTAEAAMILKELQLRYLASSVLILVPSSLAGQWQTELHSLGIASMIHKGKKEWRTFPVTIASIDLLKREPFKTVFTDLSFDLVIVDEAHKLSNPKTMNYQFVASLKKKYLLLLTATPVQNKSEELYSLSTLIRPGLFESKKEFNRLAKENTKAFHDRIDQLMIRTRKKDTDITWTKRKIEVKWLEQSGYEKELYTALEKAFRELRRLNTHQFTHLTLLKQGCSSSIALLKALRREQHKDICHILGPILDITPDQLETVKGKEILNIIKNRQDKVLIFTQYRATQLYLQWYLKQHQISSVMFRGGFKKGKKKWMTDLFRDHADVMIATEAGSEGLNLQFCSCVIHADLPWNPMKLEQRIGRVHRLGQKNDVDIIYLLNRNTIEERIWKLLENKVHLFETIIGKHEQILSPAKLEAEKYLEDALTNSRSENELTYKLNLLENYLASEDVDDERKLQTGH
ncbi:DEAD/DEAH box helicase [Jeotgalibacillus haloalkalitolerans]|uniref:SNF2-related protein n=1 Tax=Jeotgalibacillus haloalkalitolerans TaxID=3104292 RepID=A0ABU5KLK1_9BACL|nr:SNF2-related protein [Jeotgalibacillus sp. HH7-29]MDZ5712147.1 SNF2-related protein [Jeotgalibacillus sp. HH7-29]